MLIIFWLGARVVAADSVLAHDRKVELVYEWTNFIEQLLPQNHSAYFKYWNFFCEYNRTSKPECEEKVIWKPTSKPECRENVTWNPWLETIPETEFSNVSVWGRSYLNPIPWELIDGQEGVKLFPPGLVNDSADWFFPAYECGDIKEEYDPILRTNKTHVRECRRIQICYTAFVLLRLLRETNDLLLDRCSGAAAAPAKLPDRQKRVAVSFEDPKEDDNWSTPIPRSVIICLVVLPVCSLLVVFSLSLKFLWSDTTNPERKISSSSSSSGSSNSASKKSTSPLEESAPASALLTRDACPASPEVPEILCFNLKDNGVFVDEKEKRINTSSDRGFLALQARASSHSGVTRVFRRDPSLTPASKCEDIPAGRLASKRIMV